MDSLDCALLSYSALLFGAVGMGCHFGLMPRRVDAWIAGLRRRDKFKKSAVADLSFVSEKNS